MEEEDNAYRWEGDYEKTWEALKEDESGSLKSSIKKEIDKAKKRRLVKKTGNVRLCMMRHVYVVIDMSMAMTEQDLKPNRALVVLNLLQKFVNNFFDQNPIAQLGFIITKSKRAEVLSQMSSTSQYHANALQKLYNEILNSNAKQCLGEPSLQNSLVLAEKSLKNVPSHTSREIVIIMGSLTTCDPDSIHITIDNMVKQNIRCSVIGLSAEVHICKYLTNKTGGTFGVILNQMHFQDVLNDHILPSSEVTKESSLIRMGFPHHINRQHSGNISIDQSQKTFSMDGYYCPQCKAKYSELPVQCLLCSLTLVSAPHLARSYYHLFPMPEFTETTDFTQGQQCYSCLAALYENKDSTCFKCNKCGQMSCLDCNLFIHETLHSCPGCINSTLIF